MNIHIESYRVGSTPMFTLGSRSRYVEADRAMWIHCTPESRLTVNHTEWPRVLFLLQAHGANAVVEET